MNGLIALEHYYTRKPTSKLIVKKVNLVLKNGRLYRFETPSGVFSFGKIDKASRVLIENAVVEGKKLLDLGCGYGVIGIVLKGENPDLEVYMSDINERAVRYSKINARLNNVFLDIRKGAFFEPWKTSVFDMIFLNPPMSAGKRVVLKMIQESVEHLSNGGSLQVVAFHNKGGSYIKKAMRERFGNVEDICKTGGIRVYRSIRRDERA